MERGDQSSAFRILLFGDTHSLVAEDSVLPVKPGILIIQVKCPDFLMLAIQFLSIFFLCG